tara:strand:- start:1093 stop:1521 length:429 start_codon:yes stop_codon:yes gene_type:complete
VSENVKPPSDENNTLNKDIVESLPLKTVEGENQESSTNLDQNRFECRSCGYIYDPSEGNKKLGIAKDTSFDLLDINTFRCPVCRAGKVFFNDIGPKSKPSGFDENLVYGFGFNSLPAGQKNILIFGGLAFAAACFLSLYSLH